MDSSNEISRKEKYRRYCDERMAQQIRENSQELRELETRIRAIYVNKTLQNQLAEHEKQRLEEKLQLKQELQAMKIREADEFEKFQKLKKEKHLKQMEHRKELQEQINHKQMMRKILYEEFLKEKLIIDEILERLQKEQMEEMQEKLRKAECLKSDILSLINEQQLWKKRQERLAVEENEKITAYITEQDDRMVRMKESEKAKLMVKRELQERMCTILTEAEREKLEREELMIEIKSKELEEKQMLHDRKQLEDNIRQRMHAKFELDKQIRDLEMKRLQLKDKNEQFRLHQLELLADQDRLEMLTKERQKIKKQEHYRIVREMLAEREAARNAEIVELLQEQSEIIALEKRRQEIFAEERMKILQQHADDIIGFLPKELIGS